MEEERSGRFDALLLATASQAGCCNSLSEDMHDGARLGGIVVRNPFANQRSPTICGRCSDCLRAA
jgi:predicted nucleic acid-binding protein